MEILLTILILTLVVSLTSVLTRLSPIQIPLPLIQIAAGALLAQPILVYMWNLILNFSCYCLFHRCCLLKVQKYNLKS